MAAESELTPTSYIQHHLTFLSNKTASGIIDFTVINWDSVFFSVVLGVLFFPFVWVISYMFIKRSIALEDDEVKSVKG